MSKILPVRPEALSPMGTRVVMVEPTTVEPLIARGAIDPAVIAIRRRPLHERAPKAEYPHACGRTFTSAAAAFAHLAECRRTE